MLHTHTHTHRADSVVGPRATYLSWVPPGERCTQRWLGTTDAVYHPLVLRSDWGSRGKLTREKDYRASASMGPEEEEQPSYEELLLSILGAREGGRGELLTYRLDRK